MNQKPNRVEVINHSKGGEGREYVIWRDDIEVELDYQDEGRTLKVFIKDQNPEKCVHIYDENYYNSEKCIKCATPQPDKECKNCGRKTHDGFDYCQNSHCGYLGKLPTPEDTKESWDKNLLKAMRNNMGSKREMFSLPKEPWEIEKIVIKYFNKIDKPIAEDWDKITAPMVKDIKSFISELLQEQKNDSYIKGLDVGKEVGRIQARQDLIEELLKKLPEERVDCFCEVEECSGQCWVSRNEALQEIKSIINSLK